MLNILGYYTHDVGEPMSPELLKAIEDRAKVAADKKKEKENAEKKDVVEEQKKDEQKKEEKKDFVMNYAEITDYNKQYDIKGEISAKEQKKRCGYVSWSNLKPGNVLTVEPGIYFIDVLLQRAQDNAEIKEFLDFDKINEYKVNYFFFYLFCNYIAIYTLN